MKIKIVLLAITLSVISLSGCGDDLDEKNSIFNNTLIKEQNEFDKWLDAYFVKPYNIRVIYNYVDIYSNYNYDLIPAEFEKAKALTYAARYLWIEPYEEHLNAGFFRQYAPRILHYVGNPGWKNNNSYVMGEAEGGLRISFFNVNSIDPGKPSTYDLFVKTMHHEFAHIFQQKKATDPAFDMVTPSAYVSDNWTDNKDKIDAWRKGCVSSYATSSPIEDFVEIYAIYVMNTPEYWEDMLLKASTDADGKPVEGANQIRKKFDIVYSYYKDIWDIDLHEMRAIVNRRMKELETIDLSTLYK